MALLNFNWPSSDLLLMFYEFFENAAHKEPGNVEDDGSGQRVEDERAAIVLVVDLLGEQKKDSEVRRTKSGEVGNHPRNQKACPPSPQAEEGDQVEEHEDANGEQLQGHHDPLLLLLHLCH